MAQEQCTVTVLNRSDVLTILREHHDALAMQFGVRQLALFGSGARDQLRPDSDVDLLVDFIGPASYSAYFGLKDQLESLLGRTVDLVTEKGLKARARQQVEKDMIRVT
jgi:uncharacterized protein